ncbi:MAG TPA: glycine zipper 2TM domain-containing protein, partial [Burkholderiales bacterium]|nr:glycine zipper 2TM domain-containing protein [Burkholderiales bacterium]
PAAAGAPAQPQERSLLGPVVGGVAGAIIGHQVGRGSGKTAATAAGAAVGTIVGDRVANPGSGDRPVTGAAVGAAAGGLIGAQVGKGSGRDAAAAAGAITGAIVGDRVQNPQVATAAQAPQNCRTVETARDVVKGYTVVYRYNGRDITTTLPYNPGSTVRVGVSVIDSVSSATPTAGMMGASAREASRPAPVHDIAPVSAGGSGGYQYRY